MLLRYAKHLADGHGIVWNLGERPVDGATDFLYMFAVGSIARLGFDVAAVAWGLSAFCHVLTVALLYLSIRWLQGTARVSLAVFVALFFALGPGLALTAAYFGTPSFALFSLVTLVIGRARVDDRLGDWADTGYAFSCLILGLIRPEGIFLGAFITISLILSMDPGRARHLVARYLIVMLVFGGAYFVWHWSYFGYPLPNPYYKKGGGHLHIWPLVQSVRNIIRFGWLFLVTVGLAMLSSPLRKKALLTFLPVCGFTLIWILLSDEMNQKGRFQYAALPILLFGWPELVTELAGILGFDFRLPRQSTVSRLLLRIGVGFCGFILLYVLRKDFPVEQGADFAHREVATKLRPYRAKGYTIVASEAGLLPFLSEWTAVDSWGLNDAWISHHAGQIDTQYLERRNPEVVMFHAYSSPLADNDLPIGIPGWERMVRTLKGYVRAHSYKLAGCFGESVNNAMWYYVRSDFEDSKAIICAIRGTDFGSAIDLSALAPSSQAPVCP